MEGMSGIASKPQLLTDLAAAVEAVSAAKEETAMAMAEAAEWREKAERWDTMRPAAPPNAVKKTPNLRMARRL